MEIPEDTSLIDVPLVLRNLEESDLPQLKFFRCGNSGMDEYLHDHAYKYHRTGEGITKILVRENAPQIFAYCTMTCGVWKFIDEEMYEDVRELPCVEISRLAVHTDFQDGFGGLHLGTELLSHLLVFIKREIASHVGCRLIAINAVPDKVDWYMKFRFEITDQTEIHNKDETIRMHFDLLTTDI